MHLTRFTDYSIRVLCYLAAKKKEERSTISEIAKTFDISNNHLMKVVQSLGHKRYITAIRGKNGGVLLKRDPATIGLGDLVRHMEQELCLVECFRDKNKCIITPACRLKPMFSEALEAFLEVLDRYTLADMLEKNQPHLAELMRIPASEL
ncbi:Rrf2 family transcriptional regulator [Halomonas sediminis]